MSSVRLPMLKSGGGGISYTVTVFTESGTYTKPAGLDYAIVLMVSGGGGAGSGRRGAADTNRGPGYAYNGAIMLSKFLNADLAATESVTVGAGGTGGAVQTANDTNGVLGTPGGNTRFKHVTTFQFNGGGRAAGTTALFAGGTVGLSADITGGRQHVLSFNTQNAALGTTAPTDSHRGFAATTANAIFSPQNATSAGGQINSANTQFNAGELAGFYNDANTLTGEMAGTLPETAAVQPTEFYTFGQYLKRFFPWFVAADANYNVGRGGLGGGCGDTAGTIAGFAGADAVGYGGGGGGGGASTNGANSGAGGNGGDGIVIIVNVLT